MHRQSNQLGFREDEVSSQDSEDEEEEEAVNDALEASESDESQAEDDEMDVDVPPGRASPRKRKRKLDATIANAPYESQIIVQTTFDAYFTYNKPGRVQTSSEVYSQLVLPLSNEEFTGALNSISKDVPSLKPLILTEKHRDRLFSQLICELNEGFNVLCYGLGSKRNLLNQFATIRCSKRGHVVVGNAFHPSFSLKDLLTNIESLPPFLALDLQSTTTEKQARRIYDFFSTSTHHLYIIIHNIDAAPLRNAKSKSILGLLAHHPHIHIIASIDHINAPLLWSSSEATSRKPDQANSSNSDSESDNLSRGFSWLWHDLTTLASYDFELAFADRSSLAGGHTGGARRKTDTLAAQNATAMTETAASHILASVTQKAQKLFILLGSKQLEAIDDSEDPSTTDFQRYGMAYDVLFSTVRDNFIATNETALRSLLGEFRDHSLILSAPATAGGGEVLWIPLRKERLANVLRSLNPP